MSLVVESVDAVCRLGWDWPTIWRSLIEPRVDAPLPPREFRGCRFPIPLAEIDGLDRRLGDEWPLEGAAARLAYHVVNGVLVDLPEDHFVRLYGGSTHGESDVVVSLVESSLRSRSEKKPAAWSEALLVDSIPRFLVEHTRGKIGLDFWTYSACTSSMHALALAYLDARTEHGQDGFVVVGVDALSLLEISGFLTARAASRTSCLPFHESRDGLLIGEGAAAMRLSQSTNATGKVSLAGIGMSCDAGHPMDPDPTGHGVAEAMERALASAGVSATDVAGLILHGTGTVKNDLAESKAALQVFGAKSPPCTSIKTAAGHTMGAAGVFNCLVAVEACRTHILPPSGGSGRDVIGGLDLVTHVPREIAGGPILACSSGFGGNNCAAVFVMK